MALDGALGYVAVKFLIVDTYYEPFIRWFHEKHPAMASRPYSDQLQCLMGQCFGTADFYSTNLNKLGHEAMEVISNDEILQRRWAEEHDVSVTPGEMPSVPNPARSLAERIPYARSLASWVKRPSRAHSRLKRWQARILLRQVEHYRPDVLLVHEISALDPSFYAEARQHVRLMIGQYGVLPLAVDKVPPYDLILSCHPGFVERFRSAGMHAEYFRLGFEATVLERIPDADSGSYELTFVGSLGEAHLARRALLEAIAGEFPLQWWGYASVSLDDGSALFPCFRGAAWGIQMYQRLIHSHITLNVHIDQAGAYAANMRLFEATGAGALLVTDWKENLHEMFEPGKEVVAYRSPEECAELIRYYWIHGDEREAIAHAGQQRTLREHTYYHRMQELVEIVTPLLRQPDKHRRDKGRGWRSATSAESRELCAI